MLRWLRENLGTLILAFIVALTVWVAAIGQEDPIKEDIFPEDIKIDYLSITDGLLIVGQPPEEGTVTIRAPRTVWDELTAQDIHLYVDMEGLETGPHKLSLNSAIDIKPSLVTNIEPETLTLTLEPSASRIVDVSVFINDEPALGYEAEEPIVDPEKASIIGPASVVEQVTELRANISLNNRRENVDQWVTLVAIDDEGNNVQGILIPTEQAHITVQINPKGGYRQVSVIVDIDGREQLDTVGHYRVADISVIPKEVIVFSSDQPTLEALPGYVFTLPLSVADATENIERQLPLQLPAGVSSVGEQTVLVQVTIVPIESSITVIREVETQGLGPELFAYSSPDSVEVILTGPSASLDNLQPEDVRVVLDMLDLGVGTYQIEPQVIVLPPDLAFTNPRPSIVEVTVSTTPPASPPPTVTP
jgi:YbbR domain-containing protein